MVTSREFITFHVSTKVASSLNELKINGGRGNFLRDLIGACWFLHSLNGVVDV